jgi:hypothetical protein
MTQFPEMVRNVAIVGHLHHGKTALMDTLVFETHKMVWDSDNSVREETIFLSKPLTMALAPVHRHSHSLSSTGDLYQVLSYVPSASYHSR